MKKLILSIVFVLGFAAAAVAHSGGTNAAGCHNDNRPGGYYHCH